MNYSGQPFPRLLDPLPPAVLKNHPPLFTRLKLAKVTSLLSCLALLVLAGSIVQLVMAALPGWYCSKETHYRVGTDVRTELEPTTIAVKNTQYGLLLISLNNGARVPTWTSLARDTCALHLKKTKKTQSSATAQCGPNCVAHYEKRCTEYSRNVASGISTFVFIVLGGVSNAFGSARLIWKGKANRTTIFCWILGVLCSLTGIIIQLLATRNMFSTLSFSSRFPVPSLCFAFYTVIGCIAVTSSAAATLWIYMLHASRRKEKVEEGLEREPVRPEGFQTPGLPNGLRLPPMPQTLQPPPPAPFGFPRHPPATPSAPAGTRQWPPLPFPHSQAPPHLKPRPKGY